MDAYDRLFHAAENDTVTDELIDEVEAKQSRRRRRLLNGGIPQAIQQSLEGVQHVAGIVGAIKEYSHPALAQKQAVDLNHAVEGGIMMCRNEWKDVAELATDFDAALPKVACLPSDIHRVVVNLVLNAAHAIAAAAEREAGRKRQIVVRTRAPVPGPNSAWKIRGPAFPTRCASAIFEPFFTTKDVGQGTGQGLR